MVIIDPETTSPADIYKLMIGSILPRPIAFVSTVSSTGGYNLAPFSFFTACGANPPVVCFSPMINFEGRRRDTLNNCEQQGEFVVNVVSEDFVERMNATAADFAAEVDEFQIAGLTPVPCELVAAPRVLESRISMECKLLQIVEISQEILGASLVIGRIVRFHVEDDLIDDYRIDPEKLKPIGRMAGNTYTRTTDRFDMPRPTATDGGSAGHAWSDYRPTVDKST